MCAYIYFEVSRKYCSKLIYPGRWCMREWSLSWEIKKNYTLFFKIASNNQRIWYLASFDVTENCYRHNLLSELVFLEPKRARRLSVPFFSVSVSVQILPPPYCNNRSLCSRLKTNQIIASISETYSGFFLFGWTQLQILSVFTIMPINLCRWYE